MFFILSISLLLPWLINFLECPRYAAVAFGRSCCIDDSNCNIGVVSNVGDLSSGQGPLLEYHGRKFQLYRIMGPFLGRRLQGNRLETAKTLHEQLVAWEKQVPDSLRLTTYESDDTPRHPPLLHLGALALQLSYDNLQIILHRSVAFENTSHEFDLGGGESGTECAIFSRRQLLESALRTSEVHRYSHLLRACLKTHAAMHLGLCLFPSGVVLCALALIEPLSTTSQKAKAGIMRIIRLQKERVSNKHVLSSQSVKILEDLVTVIMQAEHRTILGDPIPGDMTEPREQDKQDANGPSTSSHIQTNAGSWPLQTVASNQSTLNTLQEGNIHAQHTIAYPGTMLTGRKFSCKSFTVSTAEYPRNCARYA